MIVPGCRTFDSNNSNYSLTSTHCTEEMGQCDYLCSDCECTTSSCSSGIGSNKDITGPSVLTDRKNKSNSTIDRNQSDNIQILLEHRRKCQIHLDKIDSIINIQLNKSSHEVLTKKYFLLQNEMVIQKKSCEIKDEIQKLRISISNETVEQVQCCVNSRIIFIVFVLIIYMILNFMMLGRLCSF